MTELTISSKPFVAIPTSMDQAMKLATIIANSDLAPKDYKGKPENTFIAMQMGGEVGLSPMQAIQNISVINGRPSVWGDAALGLCQVSKFFGGCREWSEGIFPNDDYTAYCEVIRKGEEPHIAKFSVADAKFAGLWSKPGPWQNYPKRQLQMRARGFALRDKFAHCFKGLHMAEESVDLPVELKDITPKASTGKGVEGFKKRLKISKSSGSEVAEEAKIESEAPQEVGATEEFMTVQDVIESIKKAKTPDELILAADLARVLNEEEKKSIRPIYREKEAEISESQ